MEFKEIIAQLGEIAALNSFNSDQNLNPEISSLAAIDVATTGNLSYIEGAKFASMVEKTEASALILPNDETLQAKATQRGIAWIATKEPRLAFAKAIALFYQPYQPNPGIHPTAMIDPSAVIGKNVSIGAYAVVQKGVKISDRAMIHPHVVLYPEVEIGENTTLHANCTIQERTKIGSNCVIHSGAVIGGEGFGFVPTPEGWFKMEQSGYVVLEDGVEIGCNSTVDRPAVGETRIGRNTKLDNMVHIGHGCKIGSNCVMAGQVALAGGVTVGDRVMLGGQVGITNHVHIGDGVIATAQSGITNSVPPGEMVSGSPHVSNRLYRKASAIYRKLPEIYETFKQVKQYLAEK
ncbi:MAG: UDP-3-O-(3-hydroxymyristoyl)glucosamine N-acyltransferase [Stanieria sp.]